jgi:hypothetical protein
LKFAIVTPAVVVGLFAMVGELFVADRAGDELVVAVLIGDVAGKVVCPEFELSFGGVQPTSYKQPTKATVKRCCLEFRTKFILLFRLKPQI